MALKLTFELNGFEALSASKRLKQCALVSHINYLNLLHENDITTRVLLYLDLFEIVNMLRVDKRTHKYCFKYNSIMMNGYINSFGEHYVDTKNKKKIYDLVLFKKPYI